ncbi:RagB/SusD family nutrient uptake outer membrane protein [Flagellimonas sp. CMM7]|uniref:RagB/SusD family nutrient uptake outer membrane protein n=1 Tax=Flagellimonas sp. CMM7 TaxID=2654676 RepID=UPI0013D59651|nr:RagB/SusD family nutrient uptake outer membrane protein [Flagellimonas sp. CMM7]UII78999.1 RagB/SusD family nutrient uptake outer membrane protein [Flagellimonas sp. CMM7]
MKNINKIFIAITVFFVIVSCDKEFIDPINISDPEVEGSVENLIKLINGVQQRYSTDRAGAIYTTVTASGLTADELRLINPGNLAEAELINGGNEISINNGILRSLWGELMLVRRESLTVFENADTAAADEAEANSLKAYALFYEALANGTLIQFFEQVPLITEQEAQFNSRAEVLADAISDLTTALGYAQSGISSSVSSSVFQSVDLENSIQALLARYNLMAGNYPAAVTAANAVNLSVQSTWSYDAAVPNPISETYGTNNVVEAKNDEFGLPDTLLPDPTDGRLDFYVTIANDPSTNEDAFFSVGFFDDNLDDIPVYLPGEMLLIEAEALARQDQVPQAITVLNEVLTKTAAGDAFGLGANLPEYSGAATQEAVLEEIYRNRRIELFMSGMSLEDSRRFNRPGPNDANAERNRNFYPYPDTERDNNPNTPADPSI